MDDPRHKITPGVAGLSVALAGLIASFAANLLLPATTGQQPAVLVALSAWGTWIGLALGIIVYVILRARSR